jgi:hypothetical protein
MSELINQKTSPWLNLNQEQKTDEQRITEWLNSDATIDWLNSLPDEDIHGFNIRENAVGFLVKYAALFGGKNVNVDEIVVDDKGIDSVQTLFDKCCEILDIDDAESEESRKKIYDFFEENDLKNRYFFHSFNGVFEDSIRENGLSATERFWDQSELNEIHEIMARGGHVMGLGWNKINSENGIFIGDDINNIYRYAIASPEWFGQFCSEGRHIPNNPERKTAYYRRDHEAARKNIEDLCDSMMSYPEEGVVVAGKTYRNISEQEKQKILDFFEKYWKILASEKSGLKVAIIKRQASGDSRTYEDFMSDGLYRERSTKEMVDYLSDSISCTFKAEEDIDPSYMLIVDLPDYEKIHGGPSE